jgi:hypothetical protein
MYSTQSIHKAYRLSTPQLRNDLARAGVCGHFTGWTHDELVSRWLGLYGERI